MNLKINYIDNNIYFNDEQVNSIEIDNKDLFSRLVNDLNNLSKGDIIEEIYFYDKERKEINLSNKINFIMDFFNIDLNNKKNISNIEKIINNEINGIDINILTNYCNKIYKLLISKVININLPIRIENDFDINNILKLFKINIEKQNNVLSQLLLVIDIEKTFNINMLLIFINLKQLLTKNELVELYKYAIYNNINILLIDSQKYEYKIKYEKKLYIDDILNEFVV